MARLVSGMNESLDGFVDHMEFGPDPELFRHFVEQAQQQSRLKAFEQIDDDVIRLTYVPA